MISHHAENLEIGGKDFATASSVTWRVKWAITALFCIFFLWARVWEGIVAAVLNPADSPFERWGKEKQFEEAGLCWSPGSYCTSFLRFHNFFQKHIINTSVMYSTMCFCNSVVLGQKLILKATWDAMQWFEKWKHNKNIVLIVRLFTFPWKISAHLEFYGIHLFKNRDGAMFINEKRPLFFLKRAINAGELRRPVAGPLGEECCPSDSSYFYILICQMF